jgi:hypothetical protein
MPKPDYKGGILSFFTSRALIVSIASVCSFSFGAGLFMALQPRLIACGAALATFAMAIRFLTGPAFMAAASIAVGLRGVDLHAAIVQVKKENFTPALYVECGMNAVVQK